MEHNISSKQTDLAYIEASKLSYLNIDELTGGAIKNIDSINIEHNYSDIIIQITPDLYETWQIVRVLNDKETDTQAYAFKKDDEIVIAYRGSKELQDWVDTDGSYLVLNSNRTPSETRVKLEATNDSSNIRGTLGVPNIDESQLKKYEQQKLNNAFDVATQFAADVKKDFPTATIDTTGHSLGGALATYVRVMAQYFGQGFIRQTTTYAAPNVYGMFTKDVQEQINEGKYLNNTIDYTDAHDTFGTLNDRFPQVGVQHVVQNESIWLGNHSSQKFSPLFLADGEIRLTPETMKLLADKAGNLHDKVKGSFNEIELFNETHDEAIKSIQNYFEGQIGYRFDKLQVSDVKSIIDKLSMSISSGAPKFYDTAAEEALLLSLHDLQKDALDIKNNLNRMAYDFKNKDKELANWLSIKE